MSLSDLSLLTLAAAITLFITSQFARRTSDPNSPLHFVVKVLRVIVLLLVVTYFYKRFAG